MNTSESLIVRALDRQGLHSPPLDWRARLESVTEAEVEAELRAEDPGMSLQRLVRLISPAAKSLLPRMRARAQMVTEANFGRRIKLITPIYVTNFCVNKCTYCGFRVDNLDADRMRLSVEQAVEEARILAQRGFREVLLVAGEDPRFVNADYYCELVPRLLEHLDSVSVESQTLPREDYARMRAAGVEGIVIYQETYDRAVYDQVHLHGPKQDYERRLIHQEGAARAGMPRLGIGALLGLGPDWRYEIACLAVHAHALEREFPQARINFSLPRICEADMVNPADFGQVSNEEFLQIMMAMRLCFPRAGILISTREEPRFRDSLLGAGVTAIGAGVSTNPGGYSDEQRVEQGKQGSYRDAEQLVPLPRIFKDKREEVRGSTVQFEISDRRSTLEVYDSVRELGFEPVWLDASPS